MKSFKEFLAEAQELHEMVDYKTMTEKRLRKLLGDYKMKLANASTQNKKLQAQNQIGIIQSVLRDRGLPV